MRRKSTLVFSVHVTRVRGSCGAADAPTRRVRMCRARSVGGKTTDSSAARAAAAAAAEAAAELETYCQLSSSSPLGLAMELRLAMELGLAMERPIGDDAPAAELPAR